MRPVHIALAILVAAIWGFNFVVLHVGLSGAPPLLLSGLRFALAALPVIFLPRPKLPWSHLLAIAATLYIGQFTFLLFGMTAGMPSGMASVVLQSQAFFTIIIASLVLREKPTRRQILGLAVALTGLVLIGYTVSGRPGDVTALGLVLVLLGALSWGVGNIVLREARGTDIFPLVTWLSLLVTPPFLFMSFVVDGPAAVIQSIEQLDLLHIGSIFYLGLIATMTGYSLWGYFLKIYPATTVAPFSLLVPLFGMISGALLLGEHFGPQRLLGTLLILAGLAIVVLPARAAFGQRVRRSSSGKGA